MSKTLICVSFGNVKVSQIKPILANFDFAEIRIDQVEYEHNQLEAIFSIGKELIATCRKGNHNDDERAKILTNALEWGASYVDIEIETEPQWRKPIIDLARKLNRKVIISYHNFAETPDTKELYRIADSLYEAGADIAKIACMANSKADCSKILGLYENYRNLVAFCMGNIGKITRLAAPLLGAPFTYASFKGMETAPGQIDHKVLEDFIRIYSK